MGAEDLVTEDGIARTHDPLLWERIPLTAHKEQASSPLQPLVNVRFS